MREKEKPLGFSLERRHFQDANEEKAFFLKDHGPSHALLLKNGQKYTPPPILCLKSCSRDYEIYNYGT